MAEKSFGVKEINLIGASGTPTIESPNNLNLNAVNVAISTNVSVGGTLTVSGNVSIGGTLTYEDVTNVDSVGIITARGGINIPDDVNITLGNSGSSDSQIYFDEYNLLVQHNNTSGQLYLRGSTARLECLVSGSHTLGVRVRNNSGLITEIYGGTDKKIEANNSGVDINGPINIVYYNVSSNGTSAYRFSGGGVDTTEDNPDIYLVRGYTYRFYNSTGSSHPFAIRSAVTNSGGTSYTDGVSGNQNNYQTFTVPLDAPSNLYYQCTIHTQNMQGNIFVTGAFSKISVSGQSDVVADNLADTLTLSAGSNVSITTNASTDTITISATDTTTNYYADSLSFNTSNGVLTVGRSGLTDLTVDLDGRYSTTDTNYYASSLSFSTSTGVLTLGRSGLTSLTVDLDGRYSTTDTTPNSTNVANAGAIMDSDFSSNGFMKRTGSGSYSIDSSTYLTSLSTLSSSNLSGTISNSILPTSIDLGSSGEIKAKNFQSSGQSNRLTSAGFSAYHNTGFEGLSIVKSSSGWGTALFIHRLSSAGSGNIGEFQYNNSFVGSINTNGSTTTFNGGSDYRLKQDVENISDGLGKIKSLRPVKFRWKNNPNSYDSGFIAHEVQETGHFDHLVTGVKDGMREKSDDPNQLEPDYQGVDYSKFTPMLVAALKEISDKVDALDARMTSLENT